MRDIMTTAEFRAGMMRLVETRWQKMQVMRLIAAYIDADKDAKADCTAMLKRDLEKLESK